MSEQSLNMLLKPWVAAPELMVSDVTLDSRCVQAGSLFLALQGAERHGVDFLADALAGGARAVAWEPADRVSGERVEALCRAAGVTPVAVPRLGERCSELAARFFDQPSQAMRCIGVTGTDGKTSVSQFIARMLDRPEARCAVLGTLGGGVPEALAPLQHTTPDPVELQRWLARMRDAGARSLVMEVSSHALAQYRVDAVAFDIAVLTHVSRDHLDYHADAAAYAAAKARLFYLQPGSAAVLNLDDALGRDLASRLRGPGRWVLGYSAAGSTAALTAEGFTPTATGLRVALSYGAERQTLELPLLGRFNVANALAAVGALLACGEPFPEAASRLHRIAPVPGRMERFAAPGMPLAVVDYAHTPGALAAALEALRGHCAGRLWAVFGCGGDRDRGKRPEMGRAAAGGADVVVLTSDNPRHEAPEAIIAAIAAGCEPEPAASIPDRREAIRWAMSQAASADIVLIAGKGHETRQISGGQAIELSDRAIVRELLEAAA